MPLCSELPAELCGTALLVAQSCLTLCDPMDCTACQALLSMGFSRQGYWSGLPFLSPGDLPEPGIEPGSPALQSDALPTDSQTSDLNSATLPYPQAYSSSLAHQSEQLSFTCRPEVSQPWAISNPLPVLEIKFYWKTTFFYMFSMAVSMPPWQS